MQDSYIPAVHGAGGGCIDALVIPEPTAVFEVRAPDGASIFVRRHGDPGGPRMVLSHGNGFSADAYYPFWSRFTDRFDVFVHDLRNHGWNPVGSQRFHSVPTFVDDSERIVREIDRRFGRKPRIGVFHSLSTMIALRQSAMGGGGFSALVLFDPPVCPPGGFPEDMQGVGSRLAAISRRRRDRFGTPDGLAEQLSQAPSSRACRPKRLTCWPGRRFAAPTAEPDMSFVARANTRPRSTSSSSSGR